MSPSLPAEARYESRERIVLPFGLHCVTTTWQQICKGSLYVTVAGVFLHETVERTHLGK